MRTFKLSNDPRFVEKLNDIVGLYLNPPDHAIVLSCDEKSQIQALDRTQPSLPMKKGRCGTLTHDYVRKGTTTLFAAMDVSDGTVISRCQKRHRHQEWLRFLNVIKSNVPSDKEVHLICDNYATHKHEKVMAWAEKEPSLPFPLPRPTSASWLNMVERFFRDLSERTLKRRELLRRQRSDRCNHRVREPAQRRPQTPTRGRQARTTSSPRSSERVQRSIRCRLLGGYH